MTNDDLTLQQIAQSILDKRQVSGRELARQAKQRGVVLSHATINGLVSGSYRSRPKEQTLSGLAALSDYSIEQVYAAADLPLRLGPFAEDLPEDADTLSPEQRQAVLAVVRQFVEVNHALIQHERQENAIVSQERQTQVPPMTQAGASPAHDDVPTKAEQDDYGLAAPSRDARERAFDDQSAHGSEE